jgi:hypothetical protein
VASGGADDVDVPEDDVEDGVAEQDHVPPSGEVEEVTTVEEAVERSGHEVGEGTTAAAPVWRLYEDCAGEETRTTAEKEKSRVVALVSALAFAGAATRRHRTTCRSWLWRLLISDVNLTVVARLTRLDLTHVVVDDVVVASVLSVCTALTVRRAPALHRCD